MYYLAIDLGAGSGRGIVYSLDGDKIMSQEIHRFGGYDIRGERMQWNIQSIFDNIIKSIALSIEMGYDIVSLGIDTWGVDFGTVANGVPSNPYHYRDVRTAGVIPDFDKNALSNQTLYSLTGIAPNEFNTIYQLYRGKKDHDFDNCQHFGFVSSLLGYMLTGNMATEPTIASTSALYNMKKGFLPQLTELVNLPHSIMPKVIETNSILGSVKKSILTQLNIRTDIKVVLSPAHDTAAAITAIPQLNEQRLFLSAGTWSLFGTLLPAPITTPDALVNGYSNELGVGNVRFLRNITGFWILQECMKDWKAANSSISYEQINSSIDYRIPSRTLIDISDKRFTAPKNMLATIHSFVSETNQPALTSIPEIANCIYTSLALEYRQALLGLMQITKHKYESINIFGGGCQNNVLCNHVANSLNMPVFAGINEASSLGNAISQMIGMEELVDYTSAHELISKNYKIVRYDATSVDIYTRLFEQYLSIQKR